MILDSVLSCVARYQTKHIWAMANCEIGLIAIVAFAVLILSIYWIEKWENKDQ